MFISAYANTENVFYCLSANPTGSCFGKSWQEARSQRGLAQLVGVQPSVLFKFFPFHVDLNTCKREH